MVGRNIASMEMYSLMDKIQERKAKPYIDVVESTYMCWPGTIGYKGIYTHVLFAI